MRGTLPYNIVYAEATSMRKATRPESHMTYRCNVLVEQGQPSNVQIPSRPVRVINNRSIARPSAQKGVRFGAVGASDMSANVLHFPGRVCGRDALVRVRGTPLKSFVSLPLIIFR